MLYRFWSGFFHQGWSKLIEILCGGVLWSSLLALFVVAACVDSTLWCTDAKSGLNFNGKWGGGGGGKLGRIW
jgi:hypothetical protein